MPAPEKGEVLLQWDMDPAEMNTVYRIASRAVEMGVAHHVAVDYTQVMIDTVCCHKNGCPLKLLQLLMSDPADFANDVFGITKHLDRRSGKLCNDFWPRFAKENQ